MTHESGRTLHVGASSEYQMEAGMLDALKERERLRCDWCGLSGAERVRVVVHGPDLRFCDATCERQYYTNDEYR